jgi:hypothetical protein
VNRREALELLRPDHPDAHELELALLAVALLDGAPLDLADPEQVTVLLRAAEFARSGVAGAAALAHARTEHAAGDFHGPTLDETLRFDALFEAEGLDGLLEPAGPPDPSRVPLERHEVGRHAIEIWGPPPHEPRGKVIGTCVIDGAGVGDEEWLFGRWTGSRWRYTGHGLEGSTRIARDTPLLCSSCASRTKYGLLEEPAVAHPKANETTTGRKAR